MMIARSTVCSAGYTHLSSSILSPSSSTLLYSSNNTLLYSSKRPLWKSSITRSYAITREEFAAVMQDDDKLGLKSLVKIFGKTRNKAARQLEVKRLVEEQDFSSTAFDKLLLEYSSASNTVMGEELMEVMKDVEQKEGKKLITIDTYNALLCGYCNAGQMDKAVNLFEEIKKAGLQIGYVSYALLVNGYSKSNYDSKAVETVQEMERLGIPIGVEVVDSVVSVLARKGLIDQATETAKSLSKQMNMPFSANTVAALIDGYTFNHVSKGEDLLHAAKKSGTQLQPRMFNSLITNLGNAGNVDKAFSIFEQMSTEGPNPDTHTYNAILHICDKKNLTEKAFAIFEDMKKREVKPNGDTYGSLEALATRNNRNDLFRQQCGDFFFLQMKP